MPADYTENMARVRKRDLEVELKHEGSKAIIEGKTSVPFKTFVNLIEQRKVAPLVKTQGDEPIIIRSELLTDLASAPDNNAENRAQLIMVTLGVGLLTGVFCFAIAQICLMSFGIQLAWKDYFLIAGVLLGIALLTSIMAKMKRKNRTQRIADAMEYITSMLSR